MRRWNGWGDEAVVDRLAPGAADMLADLVGPADPARPGDVRLEDAVAAVPASRLAASALVSTDAQDRLRHARGQSLPDWIALRTGRIGAFPDGVARPASGEDVRDLLARAAAAGATVIPYGGGTSVVGGVDPRGSDAPILAIDLERLSDLESYDEVSGLATFGAGTTGPSVEASLGPLGRRLGHYPQSWEYSTVGGWVATRSSGQQSLGYGRIEALFAGGTLEAPAGTLDLPPHPASAAGPDLRQVVLGSEGRLGIVTRAVLRTAPLPDVERTQAYFLPDLERGLAVVRELADARLPLAMIRLSTRAETMTTLALAGHPRQVALLARYLRLRGLGPERCLLLVGAAGRRAVAVPALRAATSIVRQHRGILAPGGLGERWMRDRFRTAYLRNALWEAGYAVDTLETAADWSRVPGLLGDLAPILRNALADVDERAHAFTHLSHVYPSGSSLYTTYLFRLAADPDETLRRWTVLKAAASRAIVAHGGTISHQHGVGIDHAAYLPAEKGSLGMAALADLAHRFDPAGVMNPAVLLGGGR
ncbi:MAG TPA: FAD-binding oxidoreductase [Candidatus Limnocylindrales bacterium]